MSTKPEVREALREALAVARGDDAAAHARLVDELRTDEGLARLDSAEEYRMASKFRLRVGQVLEALARNPAASARQAFIALANDPAFLAHEERIIALIRASEHLRPAPPELVAFWDAHSQPDDGFTPTTVSALVANGSRGAIAVLERMLADPAHEDDEKLSWMRTDMLSHRNDVLLLEACGRLLAGGLPEPLRAPLVEALFDYRPAEWYKPASSWSAPLLTSASREAIELVCKLAVQALTMVRLDDRLREVVKARWADAEKLRERWAPPP